MNTRPLPRRAGQLMNPEVLEAFEFAAQADAPNTQRAYLADWKHFLAWCKNRNRCPLPVSPDDLALYLRYCAEKLGLKVSTVQRRSRPFPRLMLAMAILRRLANGSCETP